MTAWGKSVDVDSLPEITSADRDMIYVLPDGTVYGIRGTTATYAYGRLINCGFGTGTQANGSGSNTGMGSIVESGSVTYASDVTPWTDPANGDFRISLIG